MPVRAKFRAGKVRLAARQALAAPHGPLKKGGLLVEREAKLSMKTGGKDSEGRTVQHSSPFEPPYVQTGNLRASITHAQTWERGIPVVIVGPTAEAWYGRILEFGGKRILPRPFMRPALRRSRKKFKLLFRRMNLARTAAGRSLNKIRGRP